jgi:hypothetical protein
MATNEEILEAFAKNAAEIVRLEAEVSALRTALELFMSAAEIDALMEGPRLRGWNRSALNRAWAATSAFRQ